MFCVSVAPESCSRRTGGSLDGRLVVAVLTRSNAGAAEVLDSALYKRGVAKTTNREALTGPLIGLTLAEVDMMVSTTNKRKETNINARVV